jgi:murein L,D-transpeptidase YafK
MRRILPATLSLLLSVASTAWSDTGSNSIDDSSHAASTPAAGLSATGLSAAMPIADQIVVRKSQRRLFLMRHGEVLRSYRVALGLMPQGPKEQAGDFRTPEGHYQLTRRNPRSDYFLSIQVSYPNDQDLRRAHHQHVEAGGSIMLHGLPNNLRHPPEYYAKADWTDGCIAMSDSDMVELWMMTQDNTPIDILP